jgi:hypothetical protein
MLKGRWVVPAYYLLGAGLRLGLSTVTKRRCQRRRFAEVDLPMAEIEAAAAAASAARSLQVGPSN